MSTESMTQHDAEALRELHDLVAGNAPLRIEFSESFSFSGGGVLISARLFTKKGQRWTKVGPVLVAPTDSPTRGGLLSTLAHLANGDGVDGGVA